jgi:flagellar motor switch protein FliG
VAAVMMSKIDVNKAAQVLAKLPGDKARRISYAVSMTTGVTPDAVDRIGLSLAAQIDAEPEKAFEKRPDERLGAILNYSNTAVREELLQQLEQEDAEFAEAVRRSIFTFANIPERLNAIDVPKITRDVPADVLATAIAAASSEEDTRTVEFLMSNMSKRLAESIREEAEGKGAVKPKVGEKAMGAVVSAIRDLVSVGEIELLNPDDEE